MVGFLTNLGKALPTRGKVGHLREIPCGPEGRPVLAMSEPYDRGYVGWQKRTKVIKLLALLIPS